MQNIVIVGNGGIGSNLGVPLVKLVTYLQNNRTIKGSVIIKVVDGDVVERKNVIRQAFINNEAGQKKSSVTAEYLQAVALEMGAEKVKVESHPYYLKDDNIANLIRTNDIVLVGVDNYITRRIIEDRMKKLSTVLVIVGGNEYDDGDVNVIHKENGKFLTPLYTEKHPEVLVKDLFPDQVSCEAGAVSAPQLILANMTVANFMLEAVHSYLTTKKVEWHEKMFDLKTGNVHTEGKDAMPILFGNSK